jgi:glycosyltransferase involved in cell wall biosynthesis
MSVYFDMNQSPTFSIITAVKNGLLGLRETYESLLEQSSQNFEWIVIDSDSEDGTADWLEGISELKNRFYWVSEPDKGIADAWNKGLARARGNQILMLNAGDVYDSQMIERFSDFIDPLCITCCHARILNEDGQPKGLFRARPSQLWRGMHVPHNWCSVPLVLYKQLGGYKHMQHSMDFEWFHRYYRERGFKGFKVIDEVLGSYKLGGHSDIHYREGFETNSKILINNGTPRVLATMLGIAYTIKHQVRHNY